MAKARGVDESFSRGMQLGSNVVSDVFKSRKDNTAKERQRLDDLIYRNPDLMTPMEYEAAKREIEDTGTFSTRMDTPLRVVDNPDDNTRTETPRQFGAKVKPSPNDIVVVTPDLATVTGLPVGTQVQRWQIQSVFAPQKRAETIYEGQEKRQKTTIEEGKRKEGNQFRQSIAKAAYEEYLKAKQFGTQDEVREDVADAFENAGYPAAEVAKFRTKAMPEKEEQGWLSKFFGAAKGKAAPAAVEEETATRRKNPEDGKWWVFEGGEWRPE